MVLRNKNLEPKPTVQATMMELNAREWDTRVNSLIAQDAKIIALRGAGTVNDIDPASAEAATSQLVDYVSGLAETGNIVALMFDGNADNRQKPDISSYTARL